MARDTNADGITQEQVDAAFAVLEAMRDEHAEAGRTTMQDTVNEVHYFVQLYEERSTFHREYDVPEVGDVVRDTESVPRFGDGHVRVTDVSTRTADREVITIGGRETTVAAENRHHPSDAQVVYGKYVDGSDKTYAFPVTRLEEQKDWP